MVGTRFKRHIKGRIVQRHTASVGISHGIDLGVPFSAASVKSLACDPAGSVIHNHRTHHRIWTRAKFAKSRQLQRPAHIFHIHNHNGRKGRNFSQTRQIIDRGIPRVAVGCADPFARVAGRGIAMMREAGVEVALVGGEMERECLGPE